MATIIKQETVCDYCNKSLEGTKGTADVHEEFFVIRGRFAKLVWSDELQRNIVVFITPDAAGELTFCTFKCLMDFSEMRIREKLPVALDYYRRKNTLARERA